MAEEEIVVTSDMTAKVSDAEIGETAYRAYCSTYTPMIPHRPWGNLPEWERYGWNVAAAEIWVLAIKESVGLSQPLPEDAPQQQTASALE